MSTWIGCRCSMLVGQSPEEYEAQVGAACAHLRCRWLPGSGRAPGSALAGVRVRRPARDDHPRGPTQRSRTWRRFAWAPGLTASRGFCGCWARMCWLPERPARGRARWCGRSSGRLAQAVRDGSVQLWAVDPKGGMELTPGAGLFTRFAYESPGRDGRPARGRGVVHAGSEANCCGSPGSACSPRPLMMPLVVVVVDELAALTAYVGDRDLKRRAEAAMQLLLSQGRAPGVLVVAAVQDPGKDVVAFRDLFPSRIALRLLEDVQVDMVLGRSARQHGADVRLRSPRPARCRVRRPRRRPRAGPGPRRVRHRSPTSLGWCRTTPPRRADARLVEEPGVVSTD